MLFYLLLCFVVSALGAPATLHDQRQDGKVNVRTDLNNIVGLVLLPELADSSKDKEPLEETSPLEFPFDLYDLSQLGLKNSQLLKEDANRQGKIIKLNRLKDDSDNVTDNEIPDAISPKIKDSGLQLIGAQEQCGPDGYRDEEGVCQIIN